MSHYWQSTTIKENAQCSSCKRVIPGEVELYESEEEILCTNCAYALEAQVLL